MQILLTALSYDSFYDHLMQQSSINKFLEQIIPQNLSATGTDYIRLFYTRGVYAIFREWINNEHPESPEELVALILSIRKKFDR